MKTRIETDSLGEKKVSLNAYYGIQTLRAVENFPISGIKPKSSYIEATVQIKRAAAKVNKQLGLLDGRIADAIIQSADEILSGALHEWFVVDVYQAGAGTSHNMNANEVLANRAIEILGGSKGNYSIVNPNDHVNLAQSTNDVIPAAVRIAAVMETVKLLEKVKMLQNTFVEKGKEFDHILKAARTHLQDGVPVRLGQGFNAWGINSGKHIESITKAMDSCKELGIGGTAAGTGLNAHPNYRNLMIEELSRELSTDFRAAESNFEIMQSMRSLVELSGNLRNLAQDLIKIANDIRLLGSGPKTGLSELSLPPLQPGSSIMPGKVNPVMAEMLNMVCYQVLGCDMTVLIAAQAGQLELNVMMPVAAWNLHHALEILTNAIHVFTERALKGITANEEQCRKYAEETVGLITVLNPHIGYSAAAEIAQEYMKNEQALLEIIKEKRILLPEEISSIFNIYNMTEPGIH